MGAYWFNYQFSDIGENNLFFEKLPSDVIKFNTKEGDNFMIGGFNTVVKQFIKMPPSVVDLLLIAIHLRDYT